MNISEVVQQLLPTYIAARREEVGKMMQLLAASDFERLKILGHSLKGSGASFGFPELTNIGRQLEHYAAAQDATSFGRELERLKQFLEQLHNFPKPTSGS
jgi:HPt (histidine-containing phosphotransfer) domain-containing protein